MTKGGIGVPSAQKPSGFWMSTLGKGIGWRGMHELLYCMNVPQNRGAKTPLYTRE